MIVETAAAKVNLYLHVGPVRDDRLHALASLFVFTRDGDTIEVTESHELNLTIDGEFAGALNDAPVEDNLVWRAAECLADAASVSPAAAIKLTKSLPVAAGIGGGSADAAAALLALNRHWNTGLSIAALREIAFSLGADVPACLTRAPVNVTGAGEVIEPGPELPPLWICLANPRVETPTGPIFNQFDAEHPAPPVPQLARGHARDRDGVAQMMRDTRNDLQELAIVHCPVIADVLALLEATTGVIAARMSGSGATCFSLYENRDDAVAAVRGAQERGWWAKASQLVTV